MLEEIYIPDTTAITRGILRKLLSEGSLKGKLIIHSLMIKYFEKLAREGHSLGFVGLDELKSIRELCKDKEVNIEYSREIPEGYRIVNLSEDIDDILRELALEWNATLITADRIQYKACQATGIRVIYRENKVKKKLKIEEFFDENTMSIHLKEGVSPYAKKGVPGKWSYVPIGDTPLTREELEEIIRELYEETRCASDAFIEIERPGSAIIQLRNYRVVITRPPLSDGLEITAVRPIIKLKLEDYNLPEKLIKRLETKAEGILIAGAPGMGKTTFAQALAEYYRRMGKVIKTIESPRDMQLPNDITQYSKSYATSEELHDVLLLSRPDYTVFDEMRDTKDFELYTDLRLAGVGMIGVVHATSPIDAIQRFIGRVELGMIPSIIDTVIFIKYGRVEKVYELETVVKIPHGLREADLARPVVVVRDFLTGEPEYEIYVFGERTFVVPIKKSLHKLSEKARKVKIELEKLLRKYFPDEEVEIEVLDDKAIIYMPPDIMNYLSGRYVKKLRRLEKRYSIRVEIRPKTWY